MPGQNDAPMDWGTRFGVSLAAAAAALVGVMPAVHAAPAMSLKVGQAVFWPGVSVQNATVASSSACTAATCPTYALRVAPGAARLRVAIDQPSRENTWEIHVLDPKGVAQASAVTSNAFAAEALVAKPTPGTWTVRVVPSSVDESGFRMRAKLERVVPTVPAGKVALLPNLKTVPAYEFGFIAPLNPLNAVYPPDTVNPPLDVAGIHPLSCAADEMAPLIAGGGGATKCLRLTSGPINVGSGPFQMLFDFASETLSGKVDPVTLQGPARQLIHYADGSTQERAAGTYSFHKTHAHFHTDQILTYELFAVDDAKAGKLRQTGAGTKSGFCPADQLFGDWNSFTQLPAGTFGEGDSATGSCMSPEGGVLGLSVGWGDVYRWQRPGQYVEFGGQGDGLYVVRTTADKYDHILEENEADNTAYSYIRITGEKVEIIERGQGQDPWDAAKVVFTGVGPAAKELAAPEPIYVDEASVTPAAPVQVADVVMDRDILPVTGARDNAALTAAVVATAVALLLRRRVLAR